MTTPAAPGSGGIGRRRLLPHRFRAGIGCLLLLALPLGAAARAEPPLVVAYYYPWYVAGDWSRHAYRGTPRLGKYGTDSPETAARHVDWAADYGLDGLMVSWWGPDQLADRHLQAGLLQADNLERTRFALFYESLGRLDEADGARDGVCDFARPEVFARLRDDFAYLAKHYLRHPRYLRLGERPVVGFYVTRTFRGFQREHLDRLRKAVGLDLFCIADEAFFGEQKAPATSRHGKGLFDAYTAYNMFENDRVRADDTALTYQRREALPIFKKWSGPTTFVPGLFPSYADFRGNRELAGTPADFATLLDAAAKVADRNPAGAPRMILVTSFNEWWEGTTIEPADEYGTEYLEVIRRFKQRHAK